MWQFEARIGFDRCLEYCFASSRNFTCHEELYLSQSKNYQTFHNSSIIPLIQIYWQKSLIENLCNTYKISEFKQLSKSQIFTVFMNTVVVVNCNPKWGWEKRIRNIFIQFRKTTWTQVRKQSSWYPPTN